MFCTDSSAACEPITAFPQCAQFYPSTRMPNMLGQTTQAQVQSEAGVYAGMLDALKSVTCHAHGVPFVCGVLLPKCEEGRVFL